MGRRQLRVKRGCGHSFGQRHVADNSRGLATPIERFALRRKGGSDLGLSATLRALHMQKSASPPIAGWTI